MLPLSTSVQQEIQPLAYPSIIFQNSGDIKRAINESANIKTIVEGFRGNYSTKDVEDTMKKLTQIGKLLHLAYSGSKGHRCSDHTMTILTGYQSLIKNSTVTTDMFVGTTLEVLKDYKMALLFAQSDSKDGILRALKTIARTAELAEKMQICSQAMVEESQVLCDKATEALLAANKDEYKTTEKKGVGQAKVVTLLAQQSRLQAITTSLNKEVLEAQIQEKILKAEVKEIREKAFTVSVINAIVPPIVHAIGVIATTFSPIGSLLNMVSGMANNDKKKSTSNEIGTDLKSTLTHLLESENKTNDELIHVNDEIEQKKFRLLDLQKKLDNANDRGVIENEINLTEKNIKSLESTAQFKEKLIQDFRESLKQVTHLLERDVTDLKDKEMQIMMSRAALEKELRESDAELAGTIVELQGSKENVDSLKESIKSLEIVVTTLGKIKTVFENTSLFWIRAKNQCQSLKNIDNIEDWLELSKINSVYKIEFINAIKLNGLNWLSFGDMNYQAALSLKEVKNSVDDFLCNLPNKEQSLLCIEKLSNELLAQIAEENKAIKDTSEPQ